MDDLTELLGDLISFQREHYALWMLEMIGQLALLAVLGFQLDTCVLLVEGGSVVDRLCSRVYRGLCH